jgi:hypothetical protein
VELDAGGLVLGYDRVWRVCGRSGTLERRRDHVPTDGHGLLAGQGARGAGEAVSFA